MTPPKPGSPEAVTAGCRCPRIDNCHGAGVPQSDGSRAYWMTADCPLHGGSDDER